MYFYISLHVKYKLYIVYKLNFYIRQIYTIFQNRNGYILRRTNLTRLCRGLSSSIRFGIAGRSTGSMVTDFGITFSKEISLTQEKFHNPSYSRRSPPSSVSNVTRTLTLILYVQLGNPLIRQSTDMYQIKNNFFCTSQNSKK